MLPYPFARFLAAIFLLSLFASNSVPAATYYVATTGLDSNPGTVALPWRTVQNAANNLLPGDTVLVRGGVYREAVTFNVSGSAGGVITFANYPGETPVLDGSTLTVPADSDAGLFYLNNRDYITIQGFELRNYSTTMTAPTPAGVFISGACDFIQITHCNIHGIKTTGGNTSNSGNAFAIAVYGTSTTPCNAIIIDSNVIHNCRTGSSETLAINGNVTNFQVTNNLVYDNNNIGIDFIGFEGTCPDPAQDQARGGICQGNIVWNISSQGNQAYPNGDYSADGLYVDGGTDITIEGNISYANDIGVELASEHPGKLTSQVTLQNNIVYSCRQGGLLMGGYAARGTGGTDGCTISNNTFWNDDTLQWGNGEMQLRWRTSNCVFHRNILFTGAVNFLVTVPVSSANNVNNSFDSNLYYSHAGSTAAQWSWNSITVTGFPAWQSASQQDADSLFADPQFISTGPYPDLDLQAVSPAISLAAGADVPLLEGKYTILLSSTDSSATVPQGIGYATLTVSNNSVAAIAGKLADGESFSALALLVSGSAGRRFFVNQTLTYPAVATRGEKGSLDGVFTFGTVTGTSDLSGILEWMKPRQTKGDYPAAIDTNLNVIGSIYSPPGPGESVLPGFASGTFNLSDTGALNVSGTTPLDQGVTLNSANVLKLIDPIQDNLKVTIIPSTGVFRGTFLYPVPGKRPKLTDFRGVLFQDQIIGGGFFLGPNGGGTVSLSPR